MATYSNLFIDQGSTFNFTIDLEKTSGDYDLITPDPNTLYIITL